MVAVGDVYELGVTWVESTQGTQCINVFHFRQTGAFLTAINLIGEFRTGIETQYRALAASGLAIAKYSCRSLIPHNTDFYETTLAPSLPGTSGTGPLPPSSAIVFTWRTGIPGRKYRGRNYIPGLNAGQQQGGRVVSTFITNQMANFGNQMLTKWAPGVAGAVMEFGVWSRLLAGPDPPFAAVGFTPVISFTPQPYVATMGTRRWGRGI